MRLQLKPLSSALGIEVAGVDLAQPLGEDAFRRIEQAWHEGLILLFRDQDIDEAEQAAFGARFGELGKVLHQHGGRGGQPGVMYISNIVENGKLVGALPDGEIFPFRQCYTERPPWRPC